MTKCEKQLSDLANSAQLISVKFDEYYKDRKAKVTFDKVSKRSVRVEDQEENCLLIHSVEQNRNEDTYTLSIFLINKDIQPPDIDQAHRISNKNKLRKERRATKIKHTWHNTREKVS